MALWLVRAGGHGEYESKYLEENRIYLTWDNLNNNLSKIDNWDELKTLLFQSYPEQSKGAISNFSGQIWSFSKYFSIGDWVVLPSKQKSALHFCEILSDYTYDGKAENPFFHYRKVKWIATDIPRSNFDQDLLYSFGAFMTVCQIKRNDAEKRIKAMANNGWKTVPHYPSNSDNLEIDVEGSISDIEQITKDQIAKFIIAKFKGHCMARLVDGVLKAKGYTTFVSPEGPDKGIDILAGAGSLGFDHPRICVQVKSSETPIDRPTLDQLIGTMQNVQADQGLLVSWGGFKNTVTKEEAQQFFKVRLWDQDDLIDNLLENYDDLDQDIKAELPLKQIWSISSMDS